MSNHKISKKKKSHKKKKAFGGSRLSPSPEEANRATASNVIDQQVSLRVSLFHLRREGSSRIDHSAPWGDPRGAPGRNDQVRRAEKPRKPRLRNFSTSCETSSERGRPPCVRVTHPNEPRRREGPCPGTLRDPGRRPGPLTSGPGWGVFVARAAPCDVRGMAFGGPRSWRRLTAESQCVHNRVRYGQNINASRSGTTAHPSFGTRR